MTDRAVYFAVIRWHGREQARLFFDEVPRELLRKESALVYCARLDTLANGEQMIAAALRDLMRVYQALKRKGGLPPEERGERPKKKAGETKISHEHWEPPPKTWDDRAPDQVTSTHEKLLR